MTINDHLYFTSLLKCLEKSCNRRTIQIWNQKYCRDFADFLCHKENEDPQSMRIPSVFTLFEFYD